MKIIVLGGSAFSTPALFSYLTAQPGVEDLSVTLVGRSRESALAVERAARLICGGCAIDISFSGMSSAELAVALEGADIVFVQVRPGGHIARAIDEVFPHKYGLCGDEGLGISGLRAAWRVWPTLRPLLSAVVDKCPNALIVMLTAPLSLITRMAHSRFPGIDLVGVCELPWATLKKISARAGVNPETLDFDYIGVNHLGWFYRLEAGSRDLLAEYAVHSNIQAPFPSAELVRSVSAIPTSYLRLHYFPQEVLAQQRSQPISRGAQLQELFSRVIAIYQNGSREEVVASLGLRPAPWYADAIGPLIVAQYTGHSSVPLFLSVRNHGHHPAFLVDDVLEIAHQSQGKTLVRRESKTEPPANVYETLTKFVQFEQAAAEANLHRDRRKLAEAIALHPWIEDSSTIPAMIRDITENNVAT